MTFPFPRLLRAPALLLFATTPMLAAPLRYNRDIRPLLSDNCFHCHGPDKNQRKGGLRLDLPEEALKPAKSGKTAIVPGKPDDSELIARINHSDPDELMPPAEAHKVLTAQQKAILRQWITEGAAYEAHWAYTPVTRPVVPAIVDAKARIANPIDAFIQQPLLEKGIAPSPLADHAALYRRLSLDLTGLPPSPADLDAFVADKSPDAVAKLADRLLNSPQYGERMAQHWLDVVRYADTVGIHGDQNQNAWAYRDWVIDSFNSNKRFDVFTTEQLAGDLLPNPTEAQWTATCFNRLNMVTREGGAQAGEYLAKYTADRVRTVSMAWMGSTLGCAECHDHKFDPWRQKDFYSLGAFFADMKQWGVYQDYSYTPNPDLRGWSNDHPFPPERVVKSEALVQRIALLRGKMESLLAEAAQKMSGDPRRVAAFKAWAAEMSGRPEDGAWRRAMPEVVETAATPKKAKGKAAKTAANDSPVEVVSIPPARVTDDRRIVFAGGGPRTAQITLPVTGNVCAVKLEVLPDESHKQSIARTGSALTLKPAFARISPGKKTQSLALRFADANFKKRQYANGFEERGIQTGWTTAGEDAKKEHTSVWLFQEPAVFAAGDSLRVTLPDNNAGCVAVSYSPLDCVFPVADRIQKSINGASGEEVGSIPLPEPPPVKDLKEHFAKADEIAMRWFLRSTAGDPVLKAVYKLEREILACRGGWTPVMVTERTNKPLTVRVLPRGNWQDKSGELCKPATPAFLPGLPVDEQRDLTRLDLARWITSRQNPLTARVIMNRLWKQFFGTGLSAQVDDLGAQGEAPSHPELLDWLAAEFMESGWDVRHMVRLLVLSHTYQQQSTPRSETREADPNNRWLASQNARRLEAEIVRDNALAISGLLNLTMGGPPVKPYQPADYYAGLQFPDRSYTPDADLDQWRRGIYTHWQRTFLHPMLANFDAPSREDCVAMRTSANTPQQALTLLNDPSFVEAARVWAVAVMAAANEDSARLDAAFRKALARVPSDTERKGLLRFLEKMRAAYRERPDDTAKLLDTGFAPKPDAAADKIELAAWTSVCRVILNLHETITRY
ncbi:MAG TPA: PSD1 and planctomycete cytochrome C domain-containing protein [Verrucomicrobiales bacterium]|nr:PSD1 and planctomycete cytochrome C domain-containing protein [Verrucomicrobiales bacterium]